MVVPQLLTYFGDALLPQSTVDAFVRWLPFSFTSPYKVLLFAVMLNYLPFSIALIYKLTTTGHDNVAPRKQNQMLAATSPTFARILAAEANLGEVFPIFAAAVLSATQAGVDDDVVCSLGAFWLLLRLVFVIVYVQASNVPMSVLRSCLFGASLMVVSKLFYLAAEK